MFVQDIVAGVNAKLAGETLTYTEMRLFLDETIDDINAALCSSFPSFSKTAANADYNYFPDRYIRSVVIVGAAAKFYVTDEEGIETATQYARDYAQRLFLMKRDYSMQVPEEFQADNRGYLVGAPSDPGLQAAPFWGW